MGVEFVIGELWKVIDDLVWGVVVVEECFVG